MSDAYSQSPCIRLCQIDAQTGWCLGCGRTEAEIGDWLFMGTAKRLALLAELPARLSILAQDQTMQKRQT